MAHILGSTANPGNRALRKHGVQQNSLIFYVSGGLLSQSSLRQLGLAFVSFLSALSSVFLKHCSWFFAFQGRLLRNRFSRGCVPRGCLARLSRASFIFGANTSLRLLSETAGFRFEMFSKSLPFSGPKMVAQGEGLLCVLVFRLFRLD